MKKVQTEATQMVSSIHGGGLVDIQCGVDLHIFLHLDDDDDSYDLMNQRDYVVSTFLSQSEMSRSS